MLFLSQLLLTLLSTDDYEVLHQVLKLLATLGRYVSTASVHAVGAVSMANWPS